jgi:hypothetical protein
VPSVAGTVVGGATVVGAAVVDGAVVEEVPGPLELVVDAATVLALEVDDFESELQAPSRTPAAASVAISFGRPIGPTLSVRIAGGPGTPRRGKRAACTAYGALS